jgi:hypothetical protein
MIARLKDWYVYGVCGKVSAIKSIIVLVAAYFMAMITERFCQCISVDAGFWIWTSALSIAMIILISIMLDNLLRNRVQINPWHGQKDVKRFFAVYDRDTGERIFSCEKEYILYKPKNCEVIFSFMVPQVEMDEIKVSGITAEKISDFEVDCKSFSSAMSFGLWVSFYDKYDSTEVADFIFRQYSSTGKAIGYEAYLRSIVSSVALVWMNKAEEEVYETCVKPYE